MAINNWLSDNSGALLQASAGLLGGRTANEQASMGLQAFGTAVADRKAKNRTLEFLQRTNPELAQAVEAGALSPLDAYKTHVEAMKPAKIDRSFQTLPDGTYGFADNTSGTFDALGQAQKPASAADGPKFGMTPIWARDANGNTVLFQPSDNGSLNQMQFPDGVTPTPSVSSIDLGTTVQGRDKYGNTVYEQPKDLAGAEREKGVGKAQGEAGASYDSLAAKMPGLEKVVGELDVLADKATYTAAGQIYDIGRKQLNMEPRDAAVARAEYIAMVDNQVLPLLRDTFGAAFTLKEGETLRATLGDPDKSPSEKKAVMRAFIEQKRRDLEALGSQAGRTPGQMQTKTGVSWSMEP